MGQKNLSEAALAQLHASHFVMASPKFAIPSCED